LREEDGPLTPIRQNGIGIEGVSLLNFRELRQCEVRRTPQSGS
jgi:hypothetical protein